MSTKKDQKVVFSCLPISLLKTLKEHHNPRSSIRIQYRGRTGVRDSGGSVNLKDNAKRFSIYLHCKCSDRKYISYDKHWESIQSLKNREYIKYNQILPSILTTY